HLLSPLLLLSPQDFQLQGPIPKKRSISEFRKLSCISTTSLKSFNICKYQGKFRSIHHLFHQCYCRRSTAETINCRMQLEFFIHQFESFKVRLLKWKKHLRKLVTLI